MSDSQILTRIIPTKRLLTAAELQGLSDVPPEIEWFANLGSGASRSAYEAAIRDFMVFAGIERSEKFRNVPRAHVSAWRDDLLARTPKLEGSSVRHRLSALSSLSEYLCEKNAVTPNPVKGVRRPKVETSEGKTPAIGDDQARKLLWRPARRPRPAPKPSKRSAIGPSSRRCSITRCAARSSASSRSRTSSTSAAASRT